MGDPAGGLELLSVGGGEVEGDEIVRAFVHDPLQIVGGVRGFAGKKLLFGFRQTLTRLNGLTAKAGGIRRGESGRFGVNRRRQEQHKDTASSANGSLHRITIREVSASIVDITAESTSSAAELFRPFST